MSVANYLTSVFDHTRIIVSVKYTKNVNESTVKVILDKLQKQRRLVINDAGCAINVSFEVDASPANSAWGAFQAHRQVLGLIFIAEAASAMEAALVQDKFNKIKEEYGPGLYHSRCIIFGVDTTIRHSHNQDIFQFSSHEAWKSADYDIKELVTSIFYDLESKRLKMAQEKNGKPPLIVAPFEVGDSESLADSDNKTFRKKCLGRHHKHLADVSLLAGQLPESLLCYHSALDILISTNDTMWIGSALEGLCVVSAQVFFPDLDPEQNLWVKEKASKQVLDPRNLVNKQISAPTLTELQKLCIPTVEDLVDRYKEAIIHYSRSKSLGIVEMEACIKATKVLTKAKKYLEASEFLQNAVYITLNLPEAERIKRYSVLADLYKGIGFQRKASFYKRVAAMQCVAPQLKEPDWDLCNTLLLESLTGYNLNLEDDCSDITNKSHDTGWPNVRLRILHELVFSSEKIGKHPLANRYMLFLLLQMLPHLSETEEKDICSALESYMKRDEVPKKESDTSFLPELTLYVLPVLRSVAAQSLANEAKPLKVGPGSAKSDSVFIYTPSSFQKQTVDNQKMKFTWCVNAACTINICMYNPLAFSLLHVSNISLLADESSSKVVYQPLTFSLPPKSTKEVTLIATPASAGTIKLIGYEISVFGTSSKCYFKNVPDMQTSEINIEVIQELPLLKCSNTIRDKTSVDNCTPLVAVYCGEKHVVPFMLTNVGQCQVQDVRILVKEKPSEAHMMVAFSDLKDDLPLNPNATLMLAVTIEPTVKCSSEKAMPCTFTIQYAGNIKENTWWRSVDIEMNIKLDVCLQLKKISIENSADDPENMCVCILEVENNSPELVHLQYDCPLQISEVRDRKIFGIASTTFKKLNVSMKRLCLSSTGNVDPTSIEDFCMNYLVDLMNLTWKIHSEHVNDQRTGDIHIEGELSRSSICSMLKSPVSCRVNLDGSPVILNKPFAAYVGEPYEVCFEFLNTTESPWKFEVQLDVFQDQQNGFIEWNMDKCVLCVGSTKQRLDIKAQDVGKFKCTVLFLRTGVYSLRVSYAVTLLQDFVFKNSSPAKSILYHSPTINATVIE